MNHIEMRFRASMPKPIPSPASSISSAVGGSGISVEIGASIILMILPQQSAKKRGSNMVK